MRATILALALLAACTEAPVTGTAEQEIIGPIHFGLALSGMRTGRSFTWDGLEGRVRIAKLNVAPEPETFIVLYDWAAEWTLWDPTQADIASRDWYSTAVNP